MRLAVVSPFVDRNHGTERAVAELLERLAHVYHCEIHLYAEHAADLTLQPFRSGVSRKAGTIYWHKVPAVRGPQIVRYIWWLFANGLQRRLNTWFRRAAVDLVFSPGINCLHPDAVVVHALFQRLQELSNYLAEPGGRGSLRSLHRRAYYRLVTYLEHFVYRQRSVELAAVSERTAALLLQYFHRQAVVIPNGVDTVQFSPEARLARRKDARALRNFRDTDLVLLLIGNDWRTKGLPAILSAMAVAQDLSLHLLVVGSDSQAPFQQIANQLAIASRCTWLPPQRDVMELYAAADVYVSPSLEDSFGLPVAEAMACGLPVITSRLAGVSAQIRHTVDGFVLADPNDAGALAAVLRNLHQDSGLRARIGEAAAIAAKSWSWDRNAEALWRLLNAALRRKLGH